MENRVFIIHGWNGTPNEGWSPWLKDQLEQRRYHVVSPSLPSAESPIVGDWLAKMHKTIGKPDKNTYLVGHSLGCIAILKYMESLPEKSRIGGCVLVAGFIDGVKDPTLKEWMAQPIDAAKVRKVCKNIVAISSDNDPLISNEQTEKMVKTLKAEFILERRKRHLGKDDGVYQLPSVLNAVLEMSR